MRGWDLEFKDGPDLVAVILTVAVAVVVVVAVQPVVVVENRVPRVVATVLGR